MRRSTFFIMFVGAVVTGIAALLALSQKAEDPRYARIGQKVFPGMINQVNEVTELVIRSNSNKISLHRAGKIWRVKESDNHLASPSEVYKAIVGISELTYFEPKTERKDRYQRLKLRDPGTKNSKSKRILVKIQNRTIADVFVGRERQFLPGRTVGGVYFRLPGNPLTWLGQGNPEAGGKPKDWLAREIVNVVNKRVKQVTVHHQTGEIVTVIKNSPSAEKFILQDVPEGMKLKYESDANLIGEILQELEMKDARRANALSIDWGKSVVAKVETFDGLYGVVETVRKNNIHWLRVRFDGKTVLSRVEAKNLMKRTAGWIYIMPKYEVIPILRGMKDLLISEAN